MTMSLADGALAMGAAAVPPPIQVAGYSIDSRTLEPGDLFFALRGPRHDGHDYMEQAFARGAAAAVVERATSADPRLIGVADSLGGLQSLAAWARRRWGGRVVAVTGSAGKTTTKDAIAHLLAAHMTVGKSGGNLNNHVGLPLSILRLPEQARVAVVEMGMNHAGEIRALARIAAPDVAVVTNVGHAHMESFDSLEAVALAKRELVESLPRDGVAVLNADDPLVRGFARVHAGRVVTFGFSEEADWRAERVEPLAEGFRFRVRGCAMETALIGRHGIRNLLAGLAVAGEFGIAPEQLRDAVAAFEAGRMRGERLVHAGARIWNDCYNSNPEAARGMLEALRDTPARRRIAVLGEMLELGRWAEALHREVGCCAARCGVSVLVGIRGAARVLVDAAVEAGMDAGAAYFFDQPGAAGELLRRLVEPGDLILFKGSRGTEVDKALEAYLG